MYLPGSGLCPIPILEVGCHNQIQQANLKIFLNKTYAPLNLVPRLSQESLPKAMSPAHLLTGLCRSVRPSSYLTSDVYLLRWFTRLWAIYGFTVLSLFLPSIRQAPHKLGIESEHRYIIPNKLHLSHKKDAESFVIFRLQPLQLPIYVCAAVQEAFHCHCCHS